MNRSNLHQYQEKAIRFILERGRCGLFLDMGLGKTVVTLTAVSDLLDMCMIKRVLVIAPLRVANTVWSQEAASWEHLKHLEVSICTGSASTRKQALCASSDVFIINRENIPWLIDNHDWNFDCVVVDESSSFKNSKAKRFTALCSVLSRIRQIILLTGTPSPNGLQDLWSQMYLIDEGRSLGRTQCGFFRRFFDSDYWGRTWTPKEDTDEKIKDLIRPSVMSMTAADYLDVPPRIDVFHRLAMPSKLKERIEKFEQMMVFKHGGEEISALNSDVLAGKLLQISNGALYADSGYAEIHDGKLDALWEIVEENGNENILVAYNYKHDLKRLKKRFPFAVDLDRQGRAVKGWNDGEIKMLLAHPSSAGHGINLQAGGSMIVWFGLNWSLELYQQFNARLHRQGQKKPVRVVHLLLEDSIDEAVLGVLKSKSKKQDALIEALREYVGKGTTSNA